MSMRECPNWIVEILEVRHMPSLQAPPEKPHPFLYHIRITNEGNETITLRGRKWIVREENGDTTVVEGEGVVGEFPQMNPGSVFSYNSYHVVAQNAVVEGAYFGKTNDGEVVFTRIPSFHLIVES